MDEVSWPIDGWISETRETPSLPPFLQAGGVEVFYRCCQFLTTSGVTGQLSKDRPIVFG